VPALKNLTLAEAEGILKQNQLKMNPNLTFVDTRNAKEHGKITSQSPAENIEVMVDTEVSLNIYRYPTDKSQYRFDVNLKDVDEDINLLVTLQADDSDIELQIFTNVYPPDMDREQPVMLNIPDDRHYMCRVYQNGEAEEPFPIGD
jgi:serine/threonine-protein kinase